MHKQERSNVTKIYAMKKIAIVSGTCGEEEKRKQQNVAAML
jgi:hypothetical protein